MLVAGRRTWRVFRVTVERKTRHECARALSGKRVLKRVPWHLRGAAQQAGQGSTKSLRSAFAFPDRAHMRLEWLVSHLHIPPSCVYTTKQTKLFTGLCAFSKVIDLGKSNHNNLNDYLYRALCHDNTINSSRSTEDRKMSSMLKKPGSGAFKPRAPIARRRPAPNLAAQHAAGTQPPTTETQPTATSVQEQTPDSSRDTATTSNAAESRPEQVIQPTQTTQPTSANAEKDEPTPRPSPASKAKQPVVRSENATEAPAPVQKPSVQPDPPPEAPHGASDPETSSSALDASSKSKSTGPGKGARSTVVAKPKPIAETTAPEPSSTPAGPNSTPSADDVVPSVENGEGSSTTTATKTGKATKARKPAARQPRKRKAAATTGEGEAVVETEAPPKRQRAPRKKKAVTDSPAGEAQADGVEGAGPNKRPRRKRKTAEHAEENAEDHEGGGLNEYSESSGSEEETETRKPRQKRRKRSVTPENAEEIKVDPENMTLGELTKNMKSGRKWKDAELIKAAEQKRKHEYRRRMLIKKGLLKPDEDLPSDDVSDAGTPDRDSSTPAPAASPPAPALREQSMPTAGQMMLVDGVLVLDESTTQYDRHAEADREREHLVEQEENEWSKRTNQATYMKKKTTGGQWTALETEEFYDALRMLGTDFQMIAQKLGGGKTRRHVKLKFNREERANPAAINACLIGEKTTKLVIDAFRGAEDLEESEAIEKELADAREEREAEARREDEELADEARRKREELLGKKKGKNHAHTDEAEEEQAETDERPAAHAPREKSRPKDSATHPGAKYGVGTDPDVIDETDLPPASARGGKGGRGRGRGRGGRRGGRALPFNASGFGS